MDEQIPKLFIINLPRHKERRTVMEGRLGALGLPFEFIDGVDGAQLGVEAHSHALYDSKKRLRYFGRDLQAGEIGCLLSHRKAYEIMLERNLEYAVILEDDVIFESDLPDVLRALVKTPVQWDVIRFLGSKKIYARGCRKIAPLTDKYQLARLPTAPGGAHGYLMTLGAAKTMLKHMQRNWLPIDTLQGRTWETRLETLVVYPAPLYPDPQAGSTIGDKRFDKSVQLKGIGKILFPLNRARFKLSESIGKRYVYISSWLRDRQYSRAVN